MLVNSVEGNRVNRFFNYIANGISNETKAMIERYETRPSKTFGDHLYGEELAWSIMFIFPIAKPIQGLASLATSITGGRRPNPKNLLAEKPRITH